MLELGLLSSIQRFSASLDLGSPEAALSSLGLKAEDVSWIKRESAAPDFIFKGHFFDTIGELVYISPRAQIPAELFFLIREPAALRVTLNTLREAFGDVERNESRKRPAGSFIIRAGPVDIIFTSKDISRDDIKLDGIFFRAARPSG